jgi:release factor glutamine methyltransferase
VRDHEPRGALHGGASGLDLYRRLLDQAAARLLRKGTLLMEVGAGQAEAVSVLAMKRGFQVDSVLNDLRAIPRCVVARNVKEGANG